MNTIKDFISKNKGKIAKGLAPLVIAGSIGCGNYEEQYAGKYFIDGETLIFNAYLVGLDAFNELTVIKKDSRIIIYKDYHDSDGDKINVDYVVITDKDNQITYSRFNSNSVDSFAIEEAQKQFDVYMGKIKQHKIDKEIKNIDEAKKLIGDK